MVKTGHPLSNMVTKLQKSILIVPQTIDHRNQTDPTSDTTAIKRTADAAYPFQEGVVLVDAVDNLGLAS